MLAAAKDHGSRSSPIVVVRAAREGAAPQPRRLWVTVAALEARLVERGDGGEVVSVEREGEDVVQVGLDPRGRHRLGQDGGGSLHSPREQDRLPRRSRGGLKR
eukprot:scaffold72870_cov63-Phaeocystis_antarctica.AAC.1